MNVVEIMELCFEIRKRMNHGYELVCERDKSGKRPRARKRYRVSSSPRTSSDEFDGGDASTGSVATHPSPSGSPRHGARRSPPNGGGGMREQVEQSK